MLLLLNASPLPIVNDVTNTVPQTGTVASFIRWMNSVFQYLGSTSIVPQDERTHLFSQKFPHYDLGHGIQLNDLQNLEVHPTSILPQQSIPEHNLITQMIPHDVLNQTLPFLTEEDIENFQLSLYYDKVSALLKVALKIRNPRTRSRLLRKYLKRYDQSYQQNYLLRFAAAKGMVDVVEILLQYSGVDPAAKKNWALIMAKENNHEAVCNLLVEPDIENGLDNVGTSKSLFEDIINSGERTPLQLAQDIVDLQLLLETSTKLLPHLKEGIINATRDKKNDLAKSMLYFISFDHSYFNNLVYLRQLAAGYSIRDLRKIDPFDDINDSLLIVAARAKNFEMMNFILDKTLKWNPFIIFRVRYLYKRTKILKTAWDLLTENEEEALVSRRLRNILRYQRIIPFILCLPMFWALLPARTDSGIFLRFCIFLLSQVLILVTVPRDQMVRPTELIQV